MPAFSMFGWQEKLAIRGEVENLWRQFREEVAPEAFVVQCASVKGWSARAVAEILVEYERRQQTELPCSPIVYNPVGAIEVTAQPEKESPAPALHGSDIVKELAALEAHLLLVTRTGAGKTTLLKAVLRRIIQVRVGAEIFIVDPKTTDWLGLQRIGAVAYLPSGESTAEQEKAMQLAETQIIKPFRILAERKTRHQKVLMEGGKLPHFHPVFLVVDEWFSLYDKLRRLRRLEPIQGWLNEIVAQGRELNVHAVLVSQSHNVDEIGFSKAMRRCFDFVCLGAATASFEPLLAAVSDAQLFASKTERDRLATALQQAIATAGNQRVVLSTAGSPKIAILPDLGWVHGVTAQLPTGYRVLLGGNSALEPQLSEGEGSGIAPFAVPSSEATGNGNITRFKPLYKAVTLLQQAGVADSRIIKEVLGFEGRNYSSKGVPALRALLALGQKEGWE